MGILLENGHQYSGNYFSRCCARKNDNPFLSCNRFTNECTVRDKKDGGNITKLEKCSKDCQNKYCVTNTEYLKQYESCGIPLVIIWAFGGSINVIFESQISTLVKKKR